MEYNQVFFIGIQRGSVAIIHLFGGMMEKVMMERVIDKGVLMVYYLYG